MPDFYYFYLMKVLESKVNCVDCQNKSMLFKQLNNVELDFINQYKRTLSFRKGEIIIQEGTLVDQIMYLKFGLVKMFKNSTNNRDQIISIAQPRDYVSLLTVFSNTTHQYSIAAIEDSIICSFSAEPFKELIQNNADFGLSILEKVSRTSDEIIHDTFEIRKKQLRGRIAYILLNFSENIYHKETFELPISRREIAELIEMTTENVIRILSEFRKDQIIGIDGKKIIIQDMERLKKISELG